jgi:lipopolysaccharide/colanic/teichoic acid biosynthesis glycosyltransferase
VLSIQNGSTPESSFYKVCQSLAASQSVTDLAPTTFTSLPGHQSVQSVLKRGVDIVGGLVGLLITGLLFIPIAIAIQLDNPGPILYSQVRCGYRGQTFRIWKFRSMVRNADDLKHLVENQAAGFIFKNEEDPRITRVGKFLRRTSLDEFPQFLNVLTGDMSLVGTRPPTTDEVSQYAPHHWLRLNVKPGLTGEWQVRGRSGVKDFEAIVQLDLAYQEKWSPLYDVRLILETIAAVLLRKGAF